MDVLISALAAGAAAFAFGGAVVYLRAPAPARAIDILTEGNGPQRQRTDLRELIEATPIGQRLDADLRQAGMRTRGGDLAIVLALVLVAALIALPAVFGPTIGVVLAVAAVAVPYLVIRRRAGRHAREFLDQLPAVLDLIASALRAGQTEPQSFALVSEQMKGAPQEEFARMKREIDLGANVDAVTGSLLGRLPSRELELVVDAVQLAHRVGGDLAEMLAGIAAAMRDRTRLEGEIRALTAQQRASVWLVTALAPIGLVFINLINPSWGALLFGTALGRIVLGIALFLEIIGFLVARQAAVVEV
ncbi:MAG: type II secretion system F family protein [Chloroflexi bacterium]|nr:type II secretion system F family protein [Chloroflexota bacterium]